MCLYNVSINTNFYQIRLINKCARKKNAKISESQIFLVRYGRTTFLLNYLILFSIPLGISFYHMIYLYIFMVFRYTSLVTSSADIILLVEQAQCNAELNITRVVKSIDASLNQGSYL